MDINTEHKAVFYLIPDDSLKARDLYICRVAEKAFINKHKIYIYTSNPEETQTIDTQLWTFRDISFVPHIVYSNANSSYTTDEPHPILIGHLPPPPNLNDILINLNPSIPTFYQQFTHIIEVIPNDEALRTMGRKHYKYYHQQNYKMETHNI